MWYFLKRIDLLVTFLRLQLDVEGVFLYQCLCENSLQLLCGGISKCSTGRTMADWNYLSINIQKSVQRKFSHPVYIRLHLEYCEQVRNPCCRKKVVFKTFKEKWQKRYEGTGIPLLWAETAETWNVFARDDLIQTEKLVTRKDIDYRNFITSTPCRFFIWRCCVKIEKRALELLLRVCSGCLG